MNLQALQEELNKSSEDPERTLALYKSMGINLFQELEMSSKYVNAQSDTRVYQGTMDQHSHSFYEIIYCFDGSSQYLLDTDRYRIKSGDLLMIVPGTGHGPLNTTEQAPVYSRHIMWISTECMTRMALLYPELSDVTGKSIVLHISHRSQNQLLQIFQQSVEESANHKPDSELLLLANAIRVMIEISRNIKGTHDRRVQSEHQELWNLALAYIDAHLSEHITSADAARALLVSDSTLRHSFQQHLGISFHRCLQQRRLIAAKSLMQERLSLEEIALRVGFEDYSSFYRAFKATYKVSPKEYRNFYLAE